ncbi:MAG: ferrous iron transport protein B [Thermogutta sp.]|nr:ferrous iron transport protein B [Thermogutta sp.]
MSVASEKRCITSALLGNPNTGKSTLFSALVGIYQRVGNYPGVTVEKRTGRFRYKDRVFEAVDLPGLYSLAVRSRDELVAVRVLLGQEKGVPPVDVVVCVVDASNLERNLYLTGQVLGLGIPTVVALTMVDVAERRGIFVDAEALAANLGVPVVPVQAHLSKGLEALEEAMSRVVESPPVPHVPELPETISAETDRLLEAFAERGLLAVIDPESGGPNAGGAAEKAATAPSDGCADNPSVQALVPNGSRRDWRTRFWVERLLLDQSGFLQGQLLGKDAPAATGLIREARARIAAQGASASEIEVHSRYDWVSDVLENVVTYPKEDAATFSDRLDAVLTHRLWGTLIFALVMTVMFQAVFRAAEPFSQAIDGGVQYLAGLVSEAIPPGAMHSLVVDGVLGGVGAVLTFVPQIAVLFAFIALLEDCGYIARSAYLMDRFMTRIGLSGKSFIPILSSFACAVPGIMATRTIENERDRLTTILIAPLMTCSARLPVYGLLIYVFIPDHRYLWGMLSLRGLVLTGLYGLGIGVAVVVALLLKRVIFRGGPPSFVLELPAYKFPSPRTVLLRVWERVVVFVRNAGTLILAVSIVVWALLYYPHNAEVVEAPYAAEREQLRERLDRLPADSPDRQSVQARLADLQSEIQTAYQRQSWMGRLGRLIEPVFRPLGWDWRISTAVIASFPAREVVVATLGVMFHLGGSEDDPDPSSEQKAGELHARLQAAVWEGTDRPVFNIPVALSIMVFFALCAQCAATLAVIRRETNSLFWPIFTFTYMTVLAYSAALVTYQVAFRMLGG